MANLSAHGRKEVLRAVKQIVPEPDNMEDGGTIGARREYRLMDDGTVLRNYYWSHINPFNDRSESQSTGWKRYAKLKAGSSAQDFAALYEKAGYTIIHAG